MKKCIKDEWLTIIFHSSYVFHKSWNCAKWLCKTKRTYGINIREGHCAISFGVRSALSLNQKKVVKFMTLLMSFYCD